MSCLDSKKGHKINNNNKKSVLFSGYHLQCFSEGFHRLLQVLLTDGALASLFKAELIFSDSSSLVNRTAWFVFQMVTRVSS